MMNNYKMDDMVRRKLLSQMQNERGADDPYDEYSKAAIDSATLGGFAGGMAQLGTVHGKTPDASPYIEASQRMLQPLKESAMQIEKERNLDPRILAYLTKNQPKSQIGKLLPQRNTANEYLYQDPDGGVRSSGIQGPVPTVRPTAAPKPTVMSKGDGQATAATIGLQQNAGLFKRMQADFDKAYKDGYAGPVKGRLYEKWASAGKTVSPEFSRLLFDTKVALQERVKELSGSAASDSERKNIAASMPTVAMDPEPFKMAMEKTKELVLNAANRVRAEKGWPLLTMEDLDSDVKLPMGPGPAQGSTQPAGGSDLTPEELKEYNLRKSKQGAKPK